MSMCVERQACCVEEEDSWVAGPAEGAGKDHDDKASYG